MLPSIPFPVLVHSVAKLFFSDRAFLCSTVTCSSFCQDSSAVIIFSYWSVVRRAFSSSLPVCHSLFPWLRYHELLITGGCAVCVHHSQIREGPLIWGFPDCSMSTDSSTGSKWSLPVLQQIRVLCDQYLQQCFPVLTGVLDHSYTF